MSQGEVMLSIGSLAIATIGWIHWWWRFSSVLPLRKAGPARSYVAAMPIACGALLYLLLRGLAASDVRDDSRYLSQYLLLGGVWLLGWEQVVRWLGLDARGDVAERGNGAAALAIGGALLGGTLAFAGANVGEGPGFEVVLFTAGLATVAHAAMAALHTTLGHAHELVTVDRDASAGWRTGAFHVAAGLIAGRAAAGDWHSGKAAVADFASHGWPLLPLALAAAFIDRHSRPTPEQPTPSIVASGLVPAAGYVAIAVAWLVQLGAP